MLRVVAFVSCCLALPLLPVGDQGKEREVGKKKGSRYQPIKTKMNYKKKKTHRNLYENK